MRGESGEEPPIRPSIPPLLWAAAAFWAGIACAEWCAWRAWASGSAVWLMVLAVAAVAGVAAALPFRRRGVVVLLAAVSLAAGLTTGSLYWWGWSNEVTVCRHSAATRWTVEVTGDAAQGTFGSFAAGRIEGPLVRGAGVELEFAKGARIPEPGEIVDVVGSLKTCGTDTSAREKHQAGTIGALRVRQVRAAKWGRDPAGLAGPIRSWARARLGEVSGDGAAMLSSVLLGDASRTAGTQAAADYKACGISHLVVASGVHLLVIAALAQWVLTRTRLSRLLRSAIVCALLCGFAAVTAFRPSVVRGALVALVALVAPGVGRRIDGLAATSAAAVAVLAASPTSGFSAGFALSVLGVLGILLFQRLSEAWVSEALPAAMRPLSAPVSLTLTAQLSTAAVAIPLFGTVSVIAPLANVLVAPLVVAATAGGLSALAASAIAPRAGRLALGGVARLADCVAWIAHALGALPLATTSAQVPLAAALAAAGVVAAGTWAWWPRPTRRRARLALLAVIATLCLTACRPSALPSGPQIDVLDVGQGDAILLRDGRATMLVDTGPTPAALRAALAREHISAVDEVLITHSHDDHYGGLPALKSASVHEVLVPAGALSTGGQAIRDAEAIVGPSNVREVVAGANIRVGSIAATVIWPQRPVANTATNEASVVLVVRRGGVSALLTGDAEANILQPLVGSGALGRVDVLKVGHHGSTGAVTPALLSALQPQACAISVGAGNRFGHPTRPTLEVLAASGTRVVRTDQAGDVAICLDDGGFRLVTSKADRSVQMPFGAAVRSAAGTHGAFARPCATLVAATAVARSHRLRGLESNAGRSFRSQARLPHLRGRGPPARAGPDSPQEEGRRRRRPRLQHGHV